jgi:hypothetical protein
MPLRDHFHPPLSSQRHWEGLHAQWASAIASSLNGRLPAGYFAEPQVHGAGRIEVDVATFNERGQGARAAADAGGGTATLVAPAPAKPYAPPAPTLEIPAFFPDSIEVLVYSTEAGPTLVAAVELVSPGNKDRDESRTAFSAKCAAYLQRGIRLAVVDVVTNRQANLHNALVELLGVGESFLLAPDPLYAVSYCPRRGPEDASAPADHIQAWAYVLAVGQTLPVIPLALDRRQFVPLDLDATYGEACQRNRIE